MFSKFLFALLALALTLTAVPALAQAPDEPPDNPALVDVPPDNPELPSDKAGYLDPRVGLLLVGLDDQVVFGGSFGIDGHYRFTQHQGIAGMFAFGGAAQLNDSASGDRQRYAYAFGLAYVLRASLDRARLLLGVEFVEVRDTGNNVVLNGVAGSLTLESNLTDRWLARLALKPGGGWDASDGDDGFLYSTELSVLYSF